MKSNLTKRREQLIADYSSLRITFHKSIEEGKSFEQCKKIFEQLKLIWNQLSKMSNPGVSIHGYPEIKNNDLGRYSE